MTNCTGVFTKFLSLFECKLKTNVLTKDVLIFSKLNHSDPKSVICLPSNGCQKLRFSEILKT